MVAQHTNPAQLEWVQRQLRSTHPKNVVEAGEKLGLTATVTDLSDLGQLSFPALLYWQQSTGLWCVVRGDRLLIANPLNPTKLVKAFPKSVVEEAWNGQLWQVELIQRQDKFNLSWFCLRSGATDGCFGSSISIFHIANICLATPIITQVIIDKVLVQESLSTLDVMAIALLGIACFEAILGILRIFIFTHTARRLDLGLSAQVFRHLTVAPGLF